MSRASYVLAACGIVLAEALRVLRPIGWLALFDGGYATIMVTLGDHNLLQGCLDPTIDHFVHDRWLGRRLPALARGCGLEIIRFRSHGFVETAEAEYVLSSADRSIDILRASGRLYDATALKAEARSRVEEGTFFGHIAYVSVVAGKPRSRERPAIWIVAAACIYRAGPYSPEFVEEEFCELRQYGVLRSSRRKIHRGFIVAV